MFPSRSCIRQSAKGLLRLAKVAGLVTGLLLAVTPVEAAPRIGQKLLQAAPRMIRTFKQKGYQNVGVLKFMVKKGNAPFSDRVGPINIRLAEQVQKALILANDLDDPVGILLDANAVAATLKGVDHVRPGPMRQKLFDALYPLAWKKDGQIQRVRPDAFVWGAARITPDLREMSVTIWAFDRETKGDDMLLASFVVPTASADLIDAGESFVLRGFFDGGQPKLRADGPFPLDAAGCPIRLEIYYGHQRIPYEIKDGIARIPEPAPGQPCHFRIVRVGGNPKDVFGIVLKVNGINTARVQKLPAFECLKWVLEPGDPFVVVDGWYVDLRNRDPFIGLTSIDSLAAERFYGKDIGQISLTVFQPTKNGLPGVEPPLGDEEVLTQAIEVSGVPGDPATDLAQLRKELSVPLETRGAIGGGPRIAGQPLRMVRYQWDPKPIFNAVIHYYTPRGR